MRFVLPIQSLKLVSRFDKLEDELHQVYKTVTIEDVGDKILNEAVRMRGRISAEFGFYPKYILCSPKAWYAIEKTAEKIMDKTHEGLNTILGLSVIVTNETGYKVSFGFDPIQAGKVLSYNEGKKIKDKAHAGKDSSKQKEKGSL